MSRYNGIVMGMVAVLVLALSGCSGAGAPTASPGSAPVTVASAAAAGALGDFSSAALPVSYENAVPASTQLALGILRLEDTPQAVTPAQAKTLLPLWQAFQGSALQSEAERNAVLKQIEGALTAEQVKAIAAMQLTQDDLRKWMDEHGMQVGMPPGTPFPGTPGGGPGNMTDEQRAAFRATAEASGGRGGFGNMTDEQRAAFRATAEASGGQFPQGPQGGQGSAPRGTPGPGGQGRPFAPYRVFVAPLVEMLTQRAAG